MARLRVLYYVHTYFLDSCLETLQNIKNHVDLDLMIEVSPDSRRSTVFDLSDTKSYSRLEKLERILTPEKWLLFQPYFDNISSVEVLFFKGKSMLGFDSTMGGIFLGRLIRARNYDVVHFDTASGRAISSLLFLKRNQLVLTIHDPVPHVGEESLLLDWVRFIFTHCARSILFYSYYSTQLYLKAYKKVKQNIYQLRLQPYSFIAQFNKQPVSGNRHILFFGQLSYYKGIDLLLDAIPKVLQLYPNEHFMVAGKSNGYVSNQQYLDQNSGNITFIDQFLSIEELSGLIQISKFIVCPYREATQSGVLMTAFAMGKTVLATNVGAFPEYISNGNNALLCDPDSLSIAKGIISMLDSDHYLQLEQNIVPDHSKSADIQNMNTLMHVYQNS